MTFKDTFWIAKHSNDSAQFRDKKFWGLTHLLQVWGL